MNKKLQTRCNTLMTTIVENNCVDVDILFKKLHENKAYRSNYYHKAVLDFFIEHNICLTKDNKVLGSNFTVSEIKYLNNLVSESSTKVSSKIISKSKLWIAERYLNEKVNEKVPEVYIEEDLDSEEEPATSRFSTIEDDILSMYLRDIGKYPLLSAQEEYTLSKQYKENGDKAAREKLITHNLKLVVSVCKPFQNKGLPMIDLIQLGNLGLMTAIEKFDPDLGYRLSTYATWWIKQSVLRGLYRDSKLVRMPIHASEQAYKIKKAKETLTDILDRDPTNEELANYINENKLFGSSINGITALDIHIYTYFYELNSIISLDLPILNADGDPDTTIGDYIASDEKTPEEIATMVDLTKVINDIMDKVLKPNEINVITKRFGLNGSRRYTLEEIADEYGITRERIRQIENRSIGKLKRSMHARLQLIDFKNDF